MANIFFTAPTKNFIQKTLSGAITSGATSITLSNTTNMQSSGYVVIDRTDSAGNVTSSVREVIYYTGISGSQLTGCVRGADNDTPLAHNDGAVVEQTFTVGMWNSLTTIVATAITSDGYLNAINSPVSISQMQIKTKIVLSSTASVSASEFEIRTQDGHLGLFPGTSKLVKFSVLQQLNVTNTYKNSQIVLTGVFFEQGDGTNAYTAGKTVTFGVTFADTPIVVVSPAGFVASASFNYTGTTYLNTARQSANLGAVSTTAFTGGSWRGDGAAGNTGNWWYVTWMAIGTL